MFREAELDLGSAVGFNNPQRRTVTADCLGRQARIEPIQGPVEPQIRSRRVPFGGNSLLVSAARARARTCGRGEADRGVKNSRGPKLIFLLVSWPQLGFGDRLFPGVLHIERVFVALAEGRLGKLLEHVRQEAVDDGSERSIWQRRNARILPPLSTPSNCFYLPRRRLPRCDVVKLIPQITV